MVRRELEELPEGLDCAGQPAIDIHREVETVLGPASRAEDSFFRLRPPVRLVSSDRLRHPISEALEQDVELILVETAQPHAAVIAHAVMVS